MRYIHWRDDFSITESFSTGQASAPVPQRVRIEYFTAKGHGRFVAERNGNTFVNCELSADGNSLVVHVSLRDRPIGHGRLLRIATVITEDANFPGGLKYSSIPDKVAAVLYFGKSDGPLEMASEIVFDGVDRLSLLEDVRLSRPNIGDLLSWNGSDWVNIPQSDVTPDLSDYVRWTELSDYVTTSQLQEILADLVTSDEITSLSQRITTLEHVQFFELDGNGNVKLKDEYGGLWASGWIATGGVGTGGSGGGGLIETVYTWTELQAMASAPADDVTAAVNARGVYEIWQAVKALQDEPAGIVSITSQQDGTVDFTFGNGDVTTVDLNHRHPDLEAAIAAIQSLELVPVVVLPTASEDTIGKIYLVPSSNPKTENVKDEYVTIRSGSEGSYTYTWEQIGTTAVDLTPYATKVTGATNGDFAGLDANGNLVDSGHKHGDYVTALGTNGNYITWTKNGVANDLTVPFATKAMQDGDGNTISSTYLKLSGGAVTGSVTFGDEAVFVDSLSGYQGNWGIENDGSAFFESITLDGNQLDWFVPVTVNGVVTLKLNPVYAGLWADGWVSAGGIGSSSTSGGALADLADVSLSSGLASGDLLKYDGTHWVNVPQSAIVPTVSVAFDDLTSHPTTLAGYGITDAKIENGVITLGGRTITPLTSIPDLSNTYLSLANGGTVAGAVDFGSGISGGQDWHIDSHGDASFSSVLVNGATVLTSHQSVSNNAATLTAGQTVTLATIGSTDITAVVPSFASESSVTTLQGYFTNGVANNAAQLDGHSASYFATAAALSGYVPTSRTINGVDLSQNRTFYALGTSLGTSAARGTMLGVSAISYDLSSTGSESSLIKWDTQLGAWHVYGNLFADGWIASGGIGTESGGGGYGVEEITSNQDGTVDFHFTGGDITTIDLNHEHPQYPKYVLCADEAAYNAIANKDSSTLYLIPPAS